MSWLDGLLNAYRTAQEESTALPQRPVLNFLGSGVTAADNPLTEATDVTITSGTLSGLTPDRVVVSNGSGVAVAGDAYSEGAVPSTFVVRDANGDTALTNLVLEEGLEADGDADIAGSLVLGGELSLADNIVWTAGATTPTISQADETANSATGELLIIKSQKCTGTGSTGGSILVKAEDGTAQAGDITLEAFNVHVLSEGAPWIHIEGNNFRIATEDDTSLMVFADETLDLTANNDVSVESIGGAVTLETNSTAVLTIPSTGVAATFAAGVLVTGAGTWQQVRRTSDSAGVSNSTTFVDDGVIQFDVEANATYLIECTIYATFSNAGGHTSKWIGPAGATADCFHVFGIASTVLNVAPVALGSALGYVGVGTLGIIHWQVWLTTVGTSGTAKLQYSQVVSDGTATIHKSATRATCTRIA